MFVENDVWHFVQNELIQLVCVIFMLYDGLSYRLQAELPLGTRGVPFDFPKGFLVSVCGGWEIGVFGPWYLESKGWRCLERRVW